MDTITVKNIPPELYEQLKESASAHHRSINKEVIACIEHAVEARPIDPEEVIERAAHLRESIGGPPITDAEFTAAKIAGRL